jgi:hypothetical protein
MTRRQFEALVERALRRLPRTFRERIANIAVVVEDWADDATLAEMGIEPPDTLYGLYRGVDLTRRDSSYGNVLPDVITIYRGGDGRDRPRDGDPRGRPLLRPRRRDDAPHRARRRSVVARSRRGDSSPPRYLSGPTSVVF